MKISLPIKSIVALITVLLQSACVVQSTHPYYTDDKVVTSPASIQGNWTLAARAKKNIKVKDWNISGNRLVTYDNNNIKSEIKIKFFKVNGVLYSDSAPGNVSERKINSYWGFHIHPTHLLSRVIISPKKLQFQLIDPRQLAQLIKKNKLSLISTKPNDLTSDTNLYIVKSTDWIKFITQYGSTPNLFNDKSGITLIRK